MKLAQTEINRKALTHFLELRMDWLAKGSSHGK